MELLEIYRFRKNGCAPDLLTAWAAAAMRGNKPPITDISNFKTADGLYIQTSDNKIFKAKEAI